MKNKGILLAGIVAGIWGLGAFVAWRMSGKLDAKTLLWPLKKLNLL
jgi:hypothetical protein